MKEDSPIKEFIETFLKEKCLFSKGFTLEHVAPDGSSRMFYRVAIPDSRQSFMVMENPPYNRHLEKENNSYLMINRHLYNKGLPVPEIFHWDITNGLFIMQDLGDINLQAEISRNKEPMLLYDKVLEILLRLQIEGSRNFSTDWCCQTRYYDKDVMRKYESDYFRDSFLSDYLGLGNTWPGLEAPFKYLAMKASKAHKNYFLHRDFQSRNIMISSGDVGILDWQGGRLGPLAYDVASLVIDPYPGNTKKKRDQIYDRYIYLLKGYGSELVDDFERYFPYLAIQRNLQILGAFAYLTKIEKKPFFSAYIDPALRSLHGLLSEVRDHELMPLRDLVNKILDMKGI